MLVNIDNLLKQFKGKKAVSNLSFTIQEGSCMALLGPNGAGKTTTLQMLARMLTPDSGSIQFNGYPNKDYRPLIGFLPQHPSFFNWMTAKEFLSFAGKLSSIPKAELHDRVVEVLAFVSLEEAMTTKIGGFSGGMKQRLGLAQALLHKPKLLILDEPVSALDPKGRRDFLQLIEVLKQNMTILFSTHILHDAQQICDEVLILQDGCLKWKGSLPSLRKEFDLLPIKLQTEEPMNGIIEQLEIIEAYEYIDPKTVKVRLHAHVHPNELLQELIKQNKAVTHFEMMHDSLEDAYMKVVRQ
ncbi:ABC transporter ATP-binding protein [Alkalihalobacillus hwajinpoensis]|uniref:ABC transporter ATP-binding protein n=1 Tax=Guptibacillus hwajinpoensis TaxID=208199 RepID=UPI00188381D4|nr:ABC transporter ATP-binding protein [Pseudalkalibacillus hwajinpoensis]MBF0707703.1 ABC transporter ATP-binding protein [Pseudalkalibacillus hwajinpoensis]